MLHDPKGTEEILEVLPGDVSGNAYRTGGFCLLSEIDWDAEDVQVASE